MACLKTSYRVQNVVTVVRHLCTLIIMMPTNFFVKSHTDVVHYYKEIFLDLFHFLLSFYDSIH